MNSSDKRKLIKRRQELVAAMSELDGAIAGSFFARQLGGHKRYCLSQMRGNKQRQAYVSENHSKAVRGGVGQYGRLMRLVRELSDVNMALIRLGGELQDDRRIRRAAGPRG